MITILKLKTYCLIILLTTMNSVWACSMGAFVSNKVDSEIVTKVNDILKVEYLYSEKKRLTGEKLKHAIAVKEGTFCDVTYTTTYYFKTLRKIKGQLILDKLDIIGENNFLIFGSTMKANKEYLFFIHKDGEVIGAIEASDTNIALVESLKIK